VWVRRRRAVLYTNNWATEAAHKEIQDDLCRLPMNGTPDFIAGVVVDFEPVLLSPMLLDSA